MMKVPPTVRLTLLSIVLVFIVALLACDSETPAAKGSLRPNIVFILADDLDATTMPYWERAQKAGTDDPLKITKALLKDEGITFENSFAPTPICCPARSTILTGNYGHNTGVLTNGGDQGGWHIFKAQGNEERTISVWLHDAGYRTALVGKYLNGIEEDPTHIPPGWDEWYVPVDDVFYFGYGYKLNENGNIIQYGFSEDDYLTDVVARKAVDFIQRADQDDGGQPFFLYVAPSAPHLPIPPAPRHANNPYKNADPPRPPNYNEPDISDKSLWLRATGDIRAAEVDIWNPIDYRNRMGSLYALDELVRDVVSALEAAGLMDNTYIIFTSDNGYNLGAHRLIHKMAPYEESIRVPFVVRGPGISAGLTDSRMALQIDYATTFAELAGVGVPIEVDGRSLVPVLRGIQVTDWRTDFIAQYVSGGVLNGICSELPVQFWWLIGQDIPGYRTLRNDHNLYVEWDTIISQKELYDLEADPYQLNNMISTILDLLRYRDLVKQFSGRLDYLESCAGSECHN